MVALVAPGGVRADETLPVEDKVHPMVREGAAPGPVEFLVVLEEQADLAALAPPSHVKKEERGRRVYQVLSDTARRTQAPLIAMLKARGLEYRPFWIANMIWVRGDQETVTALAARPEVARIDANPRIAATLPQGTEELAAPGVEWGVQMIRADLVWSLGHDGSGAVVGGQDTGYDWSHP